MSRIRSRNTAPELHVKRLLRRFGYRARDPTKPIFGRPDIAYPRLRKAIFVHGCFWHRHRGCKYTTTPASNAPFWKAKFDANVRRDRVVQSRLRREGWKVLIIWQCQTKNEDRLSRRLRRFMES